LKILGKFSETVHVQLGISPFFVISVCVLDKVVMGSDPILCITNLQHSVG